MLLTVSFSFAIFLSLAAAQILAGLIILTALGFPTFRKRLDPFLISLVLGVIGILALIDMTHNGTAGALSAVRNTWPLLLLPSVETLLGGETRKRAIRWTIAGSLLAAVAFFFQYLAEDPMWEGRYGYHSSPYAFAYLLLPPSFILLRSRGKRIHLFAWILLATAVYLVQSRGVILAWLAGSFVLLAYPQGRHLRVPWRPALMVSTVTAVGMWLTWERWKLWSVARSSVAHRGEIWQQALSQIAERPLLGHGFDRFLADPTVASAALRADLLAQSNLHNSYLMILHAAGIIGLLLMVILFAGIWQIARRRPNADRPLLGALLASLLVAGLSDKTVFMTLPALATWFLSSACLGTGKLAIEEGKPLPRWVVPIILLLLCGLGVDVLRSQRRFAEIKPVVTEAAKAGLECFPTDTALAQARTHAYLTDRGLPVFQSSVGTSFTVYQGSRIQAATSVAMPAYTGWIIGNPTLRYRVTSWAWRERANGADQILTE